MALLRIPRVVGELRAEKLLHGPIRLPNRIPMIAGAGEVGIRKRNPTVRTIA
jgi:hypothetical protein